MDTDVAFGNKGSVYLWKKPIDIVGTFIPTLQSHPSFFRKTVVGALCTPLARQTTAASSNDTIMFRQQRQLALL
jgi:hypothetical protein